MLEQKILNIKTQALENIKKAQSEKELFDSRVKYLGRKSELNKILKGLKNLPLKEKKKIGPLANAVKKEIDEEIKKAEKIGFCFLVFQYSNSTKSLELITTNA